MIIYGTCLLCSAWGMVEKQYLGGATVKWVEITKSSSGDHRCLKPTSRVIHYMYLKPAYS